MIITRRHYLILILKFVIAMNKLEEIRREIASFADDENDVLIERDTIVFERFGKTLSFRIFEKDEVLYVLYNGKELRYTTFLAKEIARLDILADKLLQTNVDSLTYIDTTASLHRIDQQLQTTGLKALEKECKDLLWSGTRICFVTADAGHGKTVLLHKFQQEIAQKYLNGESNYLFLHIDLHGRDLVRLNEAIMYDLGELRFSGLYYASIISLMKRNLLVLGIDGFDELAAEVGGEVALGSLTSLITKMDGRGVLIAASRRTFFNTQDYLKRARILQTKIRLEGEFDEIKIKDWNREQCIAYLLKFYSFNESTEAYESMVNKLHSSEHPLLARPYLFTKMVNMAYEDNITPDKFLLNGETYIGINDVIDAFVGREVLKWKDRDQETGRPYLTLDQHTRLLSEVAREMWNSQKDAISTDMIQFVLTVLFDEWNIETRLRPIIIRMAESHALLIPVPGREDQRKFDHEEFKNYFLAKSLGQVMRDTLSKESCSQLKSFLYIAQLSNNVAQYIGQVVDPLMTPILISKLIKITHDEWKPTFLQINVGTLIPYLLNDFIPVDVLTIGPKLTFSSLIFENKRLSNVIFEQCSFVNVSFCNTELSNVQFKNCVFSDLRIDKKSDNIFNHVTFDQGSVVKVLSINEGDNEIYSEYAPRQIIANLKMLGISIEDDNINDDKELVQTLNPEFKKCIKRFLNKYVKATYQYETAIKEEPINNFGKPTMIFDEIIPLLLKYNIIEEKSNKRTSQASSKAWVLKNYALSDIFMAEGDNRSPLYAFWKEVNEHE